MDKIYFSNYRDDTSLSKVNGGMFAPFINMSHGTSITNNIATQVTARSLGKAISNGALQAGLGAAVGTKDPRVIGAAAAGGAILSGMGHCMDSLTPPQGSAHLTLQSCLLFAGHKPQSM
jgi:hypothetical protein